MANRIFQIFGTFVQFNPFLDVTREMIQTGTREIKGSVITPFTGWFDESTRRGLIFDEFGKAEILVSDDPRFLETGLSFTKKYLHRVDLIHYEFKKNADGIFVGCYDGLATGSGLSKCRVNEIDKSDLYEFSDSEISEIQQHAEVMRTKIFGKVNES